MTHPDAKPDCPGMVEFSPFTWPPDEGGRDRRWRCLHCMLGGRCSFVNEAAANLIVTQTLKYVTAEGIVATIKQAEERWERKQQGESE